MKNSKKVLFALGVMSLVVGACSKEEEKTEEKMSVPKHYIFERDGKTSVDHSGQDVRLDMLEQMETKVKSAPKATVSQDELVMMYAGSGFSGKGTVSEVDLSASGKQLKNKTYTAAQPWFDFWLDIVAKISNLRQGSTGKQLAEEGKPGYITRTSKTPQKDIMVDHNGIERGQTFVKGVMGACFAYQALGDGGYLDKVLEAANEKVEDRKNYTKKEHYFDEAFGYIGFPHDYPDTKDFEEDKHPKARYWAKYIDGRGEAGIKGVDKDGKATAENINVALMKAFVAGRTAIVNKDDATLKTQIAIIRKNFEKATLAQALYYIDKAQKATTDKGNRHHYYSEALVFLSNVQYVKNAKYLTVLAVKTAFTVWFESNDPDKDNVNIHQFTTEDINKMKGHIATLYSDLK